MTSSFISGKFILEFLEKIELTFILAPKPTSSSLIEGIQGRDSMATPKKHPLGVKNDQIGVFLNNLQKQ